MKKIVLIFFCFFVIAINSFAQTKYMYVDSLEGLNVRNSPSLNGEKISLLQNKTRVEVLQINEEKINIDGILGKWVLIRTKTVQGWVFSGFLVQNINDTADNWINSESYSLRPRPYPMSIENFISSETSAFEFIAKIQKEYFYPNVTTKNFYLSFYYPLVRYIPRERSGLFQEVDIKILEDSTPHYFRYDSELTEGLIRIITVKQYKKDVLLKEMQFTLYIFDDHVECPDLINNELAKKIKIIDLAKKDIELKINHAYLLQKLFEAVGLKEGIFSKIIVDKFDFFEILGTDYSKIYLKILENNGIVLNEKEKEILYREVNSEILNYK